MRITKPFYIGKYEVTNAQFRHFQSSHKSGTYMSRSLNDDTQPAADVSWDDAAAFCEWLSEHAGVAVRLPTEAEWEYACRAGAQTAYYWGAKPDARYCNTSARDSHAVAAAVGRLRPNAFGLFDMLGNVSEWCSDGFSRYSQGPQTDPQGSSSSGSRMIRGGSWRGSPMLARAAARRWRSPDRVDCDRGFRCVAEAEPAP